jgi:hypothetical protein
LFVFACVCCGLVLVLCFFMYWNLSYSSYFFLYSQCYEFYYINQMCSLIFSLFHHIGSFNMRIMMKKNYIFSSLISLKEIIWYRSLMGWELKSVENEGSRGKRWKTILNYNEAQKFLHFCCFSFFSFYLFCYSSSILRFIFFHQHHHHLRNIIWDD